ncbi:type III secretion HpaP family protein [Ideonella sp.]|uniref:type III secretion HpaP family protein n=1 Tax=Ideonella sp. TaxID=1929293 RepID=UPI0037BFDE2B
MALNTAPSRRSDWTVRLRLREDVLPQCSLTLGLSPESVRLRFLSCDAHTLSLLSPATESVCHVLQELTGRSVEIDVVNEYFGFA